MRNAGENLRFYEVSANEVDTQIMAQAQENTSDLPFSEQNDILRRGDVIGVTGFPGKRNLCSRPV